MDTYWARLQTEERNCHSQNIDEFNTTEILECINNEDKTVPYVVEKAIPEIAEVVDIAYRKIGQGGRMIYIGAGTSGRLGILDASECPPTYGTSPDMVQGFIAGGDAALRKAMEGYEDNAEMGREQIRQCVVNDGDIVFGLSASGTAAYVVGALEEANRLGAVTVGIVNNIRTPIGDVAQHCVRLCTGPEVITGSTRMKAGTAQKLVLNMISTSVMVKLGKVYQNTMIDLKATNRKLDDRAVRIFCWATGEEESIARRYLELADRDTRLAVCMCLTGQEKEAARRSLEKSGGMLKKAVSQAL